MKYLLIRPAAILLAALFANAPVTAQDAPPVPADKLALIAAMAGEWQVREEAGLRIVFEPTAGGSVIVERWMVGERMHSMTVYHREGERLIAVHYCPQGNQPRLAATTGENGEVRFTFLDATDLDPGESYQHDLAFRRNADGSVSRAEIYWGPEGAGEESTYALFRAAG